MVSIEHMQRVRHANRGRLLLRTLGPVPFGICKCLLLRPLTLNHTLHLFMTPVPDLTFTDFDVITEYRFPKGICNGCGMPTGRLLLRTPGPVPLWDLHVF